MMYVPVRGFLSAPRATKKVYAEEMRHPPIPVTTE